MENRRILLAEDSANDIELTLSALARHRLVNDVTVVRDGEEALDYLHRRGCFASRPPGDPILIMLDLKMPKVDGLDVLREIKAHSVLKFIPVVMLTSSREQQDIIESYRLGVNAYVVKPVNFEGFMDAVERLGLFWLLVNRTPKSET
jgi:CheY-like chemotaxis protein